MEKNVYAADFVLLICTETYRRRVMGNESPGQGNGVRWEGKLIYNRIHNNIPNGSLYYLRGRTSRQPLRSVCSQIIMTGKPHKQNCPRARPFSSTDASLVLEIHRFEGRSVAW
jgi:hypothetical protein